MSIIKSLTEKLAESGGNLVHAITDTLSSSAGHVLENVLEKRKVFEPLKQPTRGNGNHYFSHKGDFLGTDSENTNFIFVLDDPEPPDGFYDNPGLKQVSCEKGKPYCTGLTSIKFDSSNQATLARIATYYANANGIDGGMSVSLTPEVGAHAMAFTDSATKYIYIRLNENGFIYHDLGNYYHLINVLIHEKAHRDHIQNGKELVYYYQHIEWAYIPQIKHPSFRKCNRGFQQGTLGSICKYYLGVYRDNEPGIDLGVLDKVITILEPLNAKVEVLAFNNLEAKYKLQGYDFQIITEDEIPTTPQ